MRAIAVCVGALALPLFGLDYLGVPPVALFAACVVAVVAIPVVFAWICRFEPIIPNQAAVKS